MLDAPRMKKLATTIFAISACVDVGGMRADNMGQCPVATCSPATPNGLDFFGASVADDLFDSVDPLPTAVGGTQSIRLGMPNGGVFQLPYTADAGSQRAFTITTTTADTITVRGVASSTDFLSILDPNGALYDRKAIGAATIQSVALIPNNADLSGNLPIVWATGDQSIAIALSGAGSRLVDTSLTADVSTPFTRLGWDNLRLTAVPAGTYSVTVTAGDRPQQTLPFDVVDHADAIGLLSTAPNKANSFACFAATNANRFVTGLPWSFVVDGVPATGVLFGNNCVVTTTKKTSGSVTVQASAGGQSMTIAFPI
jgi:hypothetical protein